MTKVPQNRWMEIFEETNGRRSMRNTLLFLSFWVSSVLVSMQAYRHGLEEWLLLIYTGVYALGYVGGKWADNRPMPAVQARTVQNVTVPAREEAEYADR